MSNLVGQGHDGVVLAGLHVVVDESDECSVISANMYSQSNVIGISLTMNKNSAINNIFAPLLKLNYYSLNINSFRCWN